ncbi:membrane bound O-acyl transferase MBOAT family protein [Deinococcus aerius]|uniref:Membrane bound O-acyl transferase MBOAT family protein n=1 Tax=Deinococcus aerius TaxID=200253 RepID=A0A2I9CY58_9DEIO|nr:MBOAT family protein [Deinococcus aerius]GBF07064.1 membrane bound O-acyl transferase MBOAT family protein [Deinococcus aerius]
MVFSSNVFLFLFLPAFLVVYYLLPFRWRSGWILVGSYALYGWWRLDFLWLLVGVTLAAYVFALALGRAEGRRRFQILAVAVALNLGALGYFKYANFGVESFNAVVTSLGFAPFAWAPILLPIGLSFFIFHAISYLVDVYRREEPPTHNLLDFAAFIALFPHLIAGPVLKYNLLADQFRHRTHTLEGFSYGATRFMTGFAKKVLIADSIAPLVTAAFNQPNPTLADSWLGALAYTLQLYFDFSGYSDMAIGLAAMMGFKFPENFNHPYISRSITEFWRRWHMSLSSWLREYLYIGLGGNRKGRARTYLNLFLTMVLGGLWHGANWTFLLWGMWHGGLLATERRMKEAGLWRPSPAWLTIPGTMLLVILGWVMFRADNVADAFGMYRGMVGLNGAGLSDTLAWQVRPSELVTMLVAAVLVYVAPVWGERVGDVGSRLLRPRLAVAATTALLPLFVLAILKLSAQSYTPFLYFQF